MFQNDSELFGRTIRVNLAKPQKIKEGSSRPVWSEDSWLQEHAGKTLDNENSTPSKDSEEVIILSHDNLIQLNLRIQNLIINIKFLYVVV